METMEMEGAGMLCASTDIDNSDADTPALAREYDEWQE